MRKVCSLIFLSFAFFPSFAQQENGSVVGIHGGLSWIGVFANLVDQYNVVSEISTSTPPALEISYDYRIANNLSIGLGLARQAFTLRYRNYEYEDPNGNDQVDNFRTDLTRLNVGIRGLFHYFRSERREMYSGIRLGITHWSFDTNAKDPTYKLADYVNYALGTQPSFQVILFGFRGYFTSHIGGNVETAIGAPHFVSFGLVYRW